MAKVERQNKRKGVLQHNMAKYIKFVAFCALMLGVAILVFLTGAKFPMAVNVAMLVGAVAMDSLTTWLCLRRRGIEGNPIVSRLFKKIGFLGTWGIWAVLWTLIIVFRFVPSDEQSQTAVASAYWLVPLNNLWVLVRLSRKADPKAAGARAS